MMVTKKLYTMKLFFRILSLACLLMLLIADWVVSQGMQNHNNRVPTNFLLLKKKNPTSKIIFVTSTKYNGNIGGLTGADAKCKALASSAGFYGEFMAWLSDSTGSPYSRFNHSTLPYVLVDGTQVAANWSDLVDGTLSAPILLDEHGETPVGKPVTWSNTIYNGIQLGPQHCADWTSNNPGLNGHSGNVQWTDTGWSDAGYNDCDGILGRLVCFEQ